jgi:hypothetical protein
MLMFGLRLGEDPRAMVTTTPRGTPMKLTPKQARFVQEYLIDLNAAQAAIRAGYSAKTARVIGHENLRKPEIAAAVEKAMAERAERTEVTADLVVGELRKIAFANMADYMKSTPEGDPYLDFSTLTSAQPRRSPRSPSRITSRAAARMRALSSGSNSSSTTSAPLWSISATTSACSSPSTTTTARSRL